MTTRIRRGLGLLTVAVLAFLVGALVNSGGTTALGNSIWSVCALVGIVATLWGLALIALGLLREKRER